MPTKLKSTISYFRFMLPGLLLILIFAFFSYIGVFIEEDPFLMLQGGFQNIYVVSTFYLLSHIVSWLICFYIFKFNNLFQSRKDVFLIPFLSILFIVLLQPIYYVFLFYFLTGLILWKINFALSPSLTDNLYTIAFLLFLASLLTGFVSNFMGIYQSRSKRKNSEKNHSTNDKHSSENNLDQETTSSFEDSISI